MPLWIVIMLVGAGLIGWAALKTRDMAATATLKESQSKESIKKAVRRATGYIGEDEKLPPAYETPKSDVGIKFSRDPASEYAERLTP